MRIAAPMLMYMLPPFCDWAEDAHRVLPRKHPGGFSCRRSTEAARPRVGPGPALACAP
jgi:hypothetical protein